ncbi:hypothetical protein CEXT_158041 [Caerostris extrusa]|uniref:Uncharacterized protein n=1 Tax=Caerostris extrusa TaxID=172846 RepID=A0AAV4WQP8_CAEEX|nr:hypothetical protein CEXT_158041 [Caerostris extrusa]
MPRGTSDADRPLLVAMTPWLDFAIIPSQSCFALNFDSALLYPRMRDETERKGVKSLFAANRCLCLNRRVRRCFASSPNGNFFRVPLNIVIKIVFR